MNRSFHQAIPLFSTLEKQLDDASTGDQAYLAEAHCLRCGKFVPPKARMGWQKDQVLLADLEKAENECEVCNMILNGLKIYRDKLDPHMLRPEIISIQCVPGRMFLIKRPVAKPPSSNNALPINFVSSGDERPSQNQPPLEDILGPEGLEFFVPPDTLSTLQHIGIGRPVSRELSDDKCTELAYQWIKECRERHPRCRQPPSSPLPSRLIDVGSDVDNPRLVENSGLAGQYAALSHCWGKIQPLVTLASNLKERQQGIPITLLPKTFRDAVLLTRRLQLQYLWIDSLCIIQDSRSDWEVESAKMGQIYRRSMVTIAATSAMDSRDGCFVKKSEWTDCVPFETPNLEGLPVTVYIRSASRNMHDISHDRLFEKEPLSSRAWVLQERLLSTRVLHYTASELAFECQTDLYCECGDFPFKKSFFHLEDSFQGLLPWSGSDQLGIPETWRGATTRASIRSLTWLRDTAPSFLAGLFDITLKCATRGGPFDRHKAFQFWRRVVRLYTARCLTFDGDVLPALSGLASLIQPRVLDSYLGGLWREDLHRQLLWSKACSPYRLAPEDHALLKSLPLEQISQTLLPYLSRRTAELSPPTWSWGSVRSAVSYNGMWISDGLSASNDSSGQFQSVAKVVAASCVPASADPTGSVLGGFITLDAPVAPVRLGFYQESHETLLQRCRIGELVCGQGDGRCEWSHQHDKACIEWNLDEWAVLDLAPETATAPLDEQEFWRLRIAQKWPPHIVEMIDYSGRWLLGSLADEISLSHMVMYHILLKKAALDTAERQNEECYERVGVFVKTVPAGEKYFGGNIRRVNII